MTARTFFTKIRRKLFQSVLENVEKKNSNIGQEVDRFNGAPIIHPSATFVNSTIGKYSYISANSIVDCSEIGKFCSIGPIVTIGYGEHPVHYLSTSPMFYYNELLFEKKFTKKTTFEHRKTVTIKNDVWIGANVFVKNGIVIGNGSIVAAGAVVTKDVPDYSVVGGVPAKILKMRFSESIISKLLHLRWWDLDEDLLELNADAFNKDLTEQDLDGLIERIRGNETLSNDNMH